MVWMSKKQALSSIVIDASRVIAEMERTATRGRGRRSALYLWFRANHNLLSAEFEKNAPSWTALAAILGERGLTNGDGGKPTAEGCRTVWFRVRREVTSALAKRAGSSDAPLIGITMAEPEPVLEREPNRPLPGPVRPVTIETDPPDYQPPTFKLATLRGATSADEPKPAPSKPEPSRRPAAPEADVDGVLADFLGTPPQTGFRPKPNAGDD